MDVRIENKDVKIQSTGEMDYVESLEELCQRIEIACTVSKGSFVYDRQLGSENTEFDVNDERLKEKLTMIFKEATIDIPCTDLRVLEINEKDGGYFAKIEIINGIDIIVTEVNIDGKLRRNT